MTERESLFPPLPEVSPEAYAERLNDWPDPAAPAPHPDDGHEHSWGCRRCGVDPVESFAAGRAAALGVDSELRTAIERQHDFACGCPFDGTDPDCNLAGGVWLGSLLVRAALTDSRPDSIDAARQSCDPREHGGKHAPWCVALPAEAEKGATDA